MSFYEDLCLRLLENTPSKLDRRAAKDLGWPQRPEDDPDISPAARRIRIMRRKGQRSGSILSGGGLQRLRRKLKSKVYTGGTETDAIQWQISQKLRKGLERAEDKGNVMSGEDLAHYKGRPSRRKNKS